MRIHPRPTLATAAATARHAGVHPRLGALLAALAVRPRRVYRAGFAPLRR